MPYADLCVTTNFSFLRGASHPQEMVESAVACGHEVAAITDHGSLAGIVRAHVAAKEAGIPLAVGSRIVIDCAGADGIRDDGHGAVQRVHGNGVFTAECRLEVLVYPTCLRSYGHLCRLLTVGRMRAGKGACRLYLQDLLPFLDGLQWVICPPHKPGDDFIADVRKLQAIAAQSETGGDDLLSLGVDRRWRGDDDARLRGLLRMAEELALPPCALGDIRMHVPQRARLLDVLSAIRCGTTLDGLGFRRVPGGVLHREPPEVAVRRFAPCGGAAARSLEIARRASAFSLDQVRYEYPDEVCPQETTPDAWLRVLSDRGAAERWPRGVPAAVRGRIEHELALIRELRYAPYFLTVHEIVAFARSRGILCQGRGAAANSTVCYCLGITNVDPDRVDLLFERFVSRERDEPPDIDIDFEHERREEVIQHVYAKYGRHRAALAAEVICYRGRSAIREVGKALGLSLDLVDALSRNLEWWQDGPGDPAMLRRAGLDPSAPVTGHLSRLAHEISGFPRHLSQHVGGFVIARRRLDELVPVEPAAMPGRTVIEWDKDDLDAMGMIKVDLLGLGMLSCLRRSLEMIRLTSAGDSPPQSDAPPIDLATIPGDDPEVYDMICAADTVGVFQIESRAQMSMLPRLRPRCWYDLVIEVAIVRPGPIQGDMVHPYLRRRTGEEPVMYPSPEVRRILERTLGVPLFQEQAMALSMAAAGFTAGEADALRRAMAAWKRKGSVMEQFAVRLVDGMLARGYDREFADRCVRQLRGFSEYGFPESHAASFAHLVYASCWIKRHHPAIFAAALINSQPMGFYAPAQIIRDAQSHGVRVLPVDVHASQWPCTVVDPGDVCAAEAGATAASRASPLPVDRASYRIDDGPALRMGLRMVRGLQEAHGAAIAEAVRRDGPFRSLEALYRASGVTVGAMRALARADALHSMGIDRRRALWILRSWRDVSMPLFEMSERRAEVREQCDGTALPRATPMEEVVHDYGAIGLTLRDHPMSFLRGKLARKGVCEAAELYAESITPNGRPMAVAGLVLVRQRPSTAGGVVFMTLEDETGVANLFIRPRVYRRFRAAARHATVLAAWGRVERSGDVVHLHVRRLVTLDHVLSRLTRGADDTGGAGEDDPSPGREVMRRAVRAWR